MRLLILTQKVDKDDPILGFFHRWLELFAQKCEKVTVICLEKGKVELPANVHLLSLGKEGGVSRWKYLFRFYWYLLRENANYDSVFVHMNPEYVILGGLFWKLGRKKVALWYVHREVNFKLRIAEKFADIIFTAAKESFNLPSKKLLILGHGIDLNQFPMQSHNVTAIRRLLQVGRITRIKHCEKAIEALALLDQDYHLRFVGGPITPDDSVYLTELKQMVAQKGLTGRVEFAGNVAHEKMSQEYGRADITLNILPTGGIDKTVLESMASGVPVLTSNQAFRSYFGPYADLLLVTIDDLAYLVRRIEALEDYQEQDALRGYLRNKVEQVGSLEVLIDRIISGLS